VVVVVINIATELTIKWNHIAGVDSVSSAGQMIPLIIGAAAVVRIFYKWRCPEDDFPTDKGPTDARDLPPRMARPYFGPSDPRDLPAYIRVTRYGGPTSARDLPERMARPPYYGPTDARDLPLRERTQYRERTDSQDLPARRVSRYRGPDMPYDLPITVGRRRTR